MNNEIKEILEYLNKHKEGLKDNTYYPEDLLSCKDLLFLLDYITNLQNNWYDLKTYCKLERHESNNMKEGEIYNEIITKMEQLERGE